jgi:tripartite-type tricarboxylate transporter receptor subunit TctC
MKIIDGYPGGNDVVLAMERGEVTGRCGWSWSSVKSEKMDWVKDGTVHILLQMSTEKHPDLPDVPLIMDLAQSEDDKKLLRLAFARQALGRPYLAPPGIPADRVEALRAAFDATMQDPEFLEEAAKADLEITPISGAAVEQLVRETYEAPPAVVARISEILG